MCVPSIFRMLFLTFLAVLSFQVFPAFLGVFWRSQRSWRSPRSQTPDPTFMRMWTCGYAECERNAVTSTTRPGQPRLSRRKSRGLLLGAGSALAPRLGCTRWTPCAKTQKWPHGATERPRGLRELLGLQPRCSHKTPRNVWG